MSHVNVEGERFNMDDPICCVVEYLFQTLPIIGTTGTDSEEVDCQDVDKDDKKIKIDISTTELVTK